jgi:hypothetical protein
VNLTITIHNANKVTFDGRDCFIVSLLDDHGKLLFDHYTNRYDPEAVSEHTTYESALDYAKDLSKRRCIK